MTIDRVLQLTNGSSSSHPNVVINATWNQYFSPEMIATLDVWRYDYDWTAHNMFLDSNGVADQILTEDYLHPDLVDVLCGRSSQEDEQNDKYSEYFHGYLTAVLDVAWPSSTELHVCCAGECTFTDPLLAENEYVFRGGESAVLAPHFLTPFFDDGQQEALTAGFIAKLNTQELVLEQDVAGTFQLGGPAADVFMVRKDPEEYKHFLGATWGNMFLDCLDNDRGHVLCDASLENDRQIGRDEQFRTMPMFTCNGGSTYPLDESGKSCFHTDMTSNDENGCGAVAATGRCDQVCLSGVCGVNIPPRVGLGTSNILYVYMKDFEGQQQQAETSSSDDDDIPGWGIALLVILGVAFVLILVLALEVLRLYRRNWKEDQAKKARQHHHHHHNHHQGSLQKPHQNDLDATSAHDIEATSAHDSTHNDE